MQSRSSPVATETNHFLRVWLVPVQQNSCHQHVHLLPAVANEGSLRCSSRCAPYFFASWRFGVLSPLPPTSASAEDPSFGGSLFRLFCVLGSTFTKNGVSALLSVPFWFWIISSNRRGHCYLYTILETEVQRSRWLWHVGNRPTAERLEVGGPVRRSSRHWGAGVGEEEKWIQDRLWRQCG